MAVARSQHYGKGGETAPNLASQFEAADPGHHHVRKDHVKIFSLIEQCQCLIGVSCPGRDVTKVLQELIAKLSDLEIVLNDQDASSATCQRACVAVLVGSSFQDTLDSREIQRKGRTMSNLAIDVHLTAGLLHKSINLRQAKPCSFPERLCREEGVENMRKFIVG